MVILVKTLGILVVCLAAVATFSPAVPRRAMAFVGEGRRLYAAAAARLLFGGLLIAAASSCRAFWLVMAIGIISLLSAVVIVAIGLDRAKRFLAWWNAKPDSVLRFTGIVAIIVGALLIYGA